MALTSIMFLTALLATTAVHAAIEECVKLPAPKDGDVQPVFSKSGQQLAIYMCNQGYTAVGDTILSCVNGRWDKIPPLCASLEDCELAAPEAILQINDPVRNCPKMASPKNGRMDQVLIRGRLQRATFICKRGYNLVGTNTIHCQGGKWIGEKPTCEPVDCGVPEAPKNGSVSFTGTHRRAKADYECDYCYIRQGVASRRCKPSATWSGVAPLCVPVTDVCPLSDLEVPDRGFIVNAAQQEEELTCGQSVQIKCFFGNTLEGSDTATCNSDGTFVWQGAKPECTRGGRRG